MSEWRTIDSAPYGKIIVMYGPTLFTKDGVVANWKIATGNRHEGYADMQSRSEGYTGWWWDGRPIKSYDAQPTHWMPLPEPPQ